MANREKRRRASVRQGDVVEVIAGAHSSSRGKVMRVLPQTQRAVVEGVNLVKKHLRKSQDYPQGGIVEKEAPIHVSNLKVVEPASG
jgi:large subunit ribosomal protein L24